MRFADIAGRDEVKRLLVEQVDGGKMPHALLLWGPEGVGKLALARALAQYIHCSHRMNGDSCGVCPACRQHASLNYPDLHFSYPTPAGKSSKTNISEDYIEAWQEFLRDYPLAPWRRWLELSSAENSQPVIRVDESAEIIRSLSLENYGDSVKVLILWLPEKLNMAAANKLLKLVEEPQPGRMFIMVSDAPSLILPTIYSRLQRVKIDAPLAEQTEVWLQNVHGYSAGQARQAAFAAQGNPMLALNLLDEAGEEAEFRESFQELMRKAWLRDVKALRVWSEKAAGFRREKIKRLLAYIVRQVRLNYLYVLRDPALTPMMDSDQAFSERFSPFINGSNVEEMMNQCASATVDISGNANARIVLFDFALSMIMLIKKTPA